MSPAPCLEAGAPSGQARLPCSSRCARRPADGTRGRGRVRRRTDREYGPVGQRSSRAGPLAEESRTAPRVPARTCYRRLGDGTARRASTDVCFGPYPCRLPPRAGESRAHAPRIPWARGMPSSFQRVENRRIPFCRPGHLPSVRSAPPPSQAPHSTRSAAVDRLLRGTPSGRQITVMPMPPNGLSSHPRA